MKKTLAAVLAAAMALSTATVAFAANHSSGVGVDNDSSTFPGEEEQSVPYNKDQDSRLYLSDGDNVILTTGELAKALDDNVMRSNVSVTSGRANFATIPNVSVQKDNGNLYTRLRWKMANSYSTSESKVAFRIRFTVAKDWYKVAVATEAIEVNGTLEAGSNIEYKYQTSKPKTVVDTSKDAAKKGDIVESVQLLKKGDTYTSDDYEYKAEYKTVDYDDEITITEQDCKDGTCRIKGEDLYNALDDDHKVSIWFDNNAYLETKIASSQPNLNLFYDTKDVDFIIEEFPDVDFEFITFHGAPSVTRFVNTGKMNFSGDRNTAVYKLVSAGGGFDDGDYLEKLDSSYEDGIVTVSGIKNLSGTFVIASEELPEQEDDEPVDDVPVVEPDSESSSTPTSKDDEKNPPTGAC